MDPYAQILHLRKKEARTIAGLMSGTSTDGLTIAITEIKGSSVNTALELVGFQTFTYPPALRAAIFELFDPKTSSVDKICRMNFLLAEFYVGALTKLLEQLTLTYADLDLIGSHGQTIYHIPTPQEISGYSSRSTLQIGEPTVIAQRTGVPTIADFRKADIAAGGEGAPLIPYLDFILHRHETSYRILQNIGGIANLTYLPAGASINNVVAFDTGPGNMIIDAIVKHYTRSKKTFDENGRIATNGNINQVFLQHLLAHPFFLQKPPKTTGREVFGESYAQNAIQEAKKHNLKFEDIVATVSMLTAESIARAYEELLPKQSKIDEIYVSGGGAKNQFLMEALQRRLNPIPVYEYDHLGFPGEAKEAVLIAVLANEHVMGNASNIPTATGAKKAVCLGQFYPAR